ncbi:MAG: AbrB/MazE/SpoVT family DNA-binding domain-containing protein [Clostridia bacterium]|nr:AbrB/MazE/SpoVT family DNA-binding domain-containing protein [Clostridia bacterium]
MKATGIVRRIDELGRVVIPKEIRNTLRLKSGEPLEIFSDRDELILKKYSPIATLDKFSESTAKSLNDLSGNLAVICDTDEVLYASGDGKKEINRKNISEHMDKIMQERKSYIANLSEGGDIVPITTREDLTITAQIIVPIISGGDCLGAVALLSQEDGAKMDSEKIKLAQLTADILAGQFE